MEIEFWEIIIWQIELEFYRFRQEFETCNSDWKF